MRLIKKVLTLAALFTFGSHGWAAGKASHVILMVWDGMRPDFVSESTTPALAEMASQGVTFLHHHPVYLSSTEVNGTALATGVYPGQSGVVGNREFRPAIDALQPIDTQALEAIRKGDELSANHYLAFPTVAEILHQHGLSTDITGSKPVAVLHDRAARENNSLGVTLFAGDTLPEGMKETLVGAIGKFPNAGKNKFKIDDWTTRALTEQLWKNGLPSYSLLWMAEPDFSQHRYGPGSPEALAAIKNNDKNLARLRAVLKEKNLEDSTDIIVVSDHGFSTIYSNIDVAATLREHGVQAYRKFPSSERKDGDVMIVGNGGEVSVYVTGHDSNLVTQIVHYLQAEPYTGVVFARQPVEGAFSLADAHLNSPGAPDVVMSLRWVPDQSKYGAAGLIYCDGDSLKPGQGQHASLSPSDMHNTSIAFGPDFNPGMKDSLPTGNIDIAPTILWILGVKPKDKMSGRVLSEALTGVGPKIKSYGPYHREKKWTGAGFTWQQYLDISAVNGVVYFDQGNGSQTPAAGSQ
jgi:arylsulfatase A-like enzyme